MKSPFHKILAITMSFVVLFSTFSFSVDMHYCGETLVDVAINKDAIGCGMEELQAPPLKSAISKKGCCTDHKVVVNGQDELKSVPSQLTLDQQLFVTTFVYTYQSLFVALPKQIIPFQAYSPPLLVSDIQLEYDTFLI
ncbi:HYC_CC_PP family protein [Formosa haliotis]|uniref:HYC_CC_PP family protein n=1 Tax=Formosa haliotis TaxID=1555194 RepID=UPI00082719CA|nr:hypothetical protein [Formosa haliotis]